MTPDAKHYNIEDKLVGEQGWKKITFPDSYGEGKTFISDDEGGSRFKKNILFVKQIMLLWLKSGLALQQKVLPAMLTAEAWRLYLMKRWAFPLG